MSFILLLPAVDEWIVTDNAFISRHGALVLPHENQVLVGRCVSSNVVTICWIVIPERIWFCANMPGKTTNVVSSAAEIQFILGLKCYAAVVILVPMLFNLLAVSRWLLNALCSPWLTYFTFHANFYFCS